MKIANRHIQSDLLASCLLLGLSPAPAMPVAKASMPACHPVHCFNRHRRIGCASGIDAKISRRPWTCRWAKSKFLTCPSRFQAGKKMPKAMMRMDAKVPDSVKDVIKHLSNKAEDITLDDLNAAREAVAKLDALIDIEKRLVDLDKIRNEREKENDKKIADAIPKTALMPPPSYMPPPMPVERSSEPKVAAMPKPMPVELEIIRIEGSNSHYGALVKDGDTTHLVHAGDHLSDGSVVLSVSTQGVELQRR